MRNDSSDLRTRVTYFIILTMGFVTGIFAILLTLQYLDLIKFMSIEAQFGITRQALIYAIGCIVLLTLARLYRQGHEWTVMAFTVLFTVVDVAGQSKLYFPVGIPQGLWLPVLLTVALTSLRWTLVITMLTLVLTLALWSEAGAYKRPTVIVVSMLMLLVIVAGRKIQDSATEGERVAAKEAERARDELAILNLELENRVALRTTELSIANKQLIKTVEHLETTRNELARVEKQAALGRLVAGVAHELNTPIGNALMASTTLNDNTHSFMQGLATGTLRKSSVTSLCDTNIQAADLIEHNLRRASTLINTFKLLSAKPSIETRSKFDLSQVVTTTLEKWRNESNESLTPILDTQIPLNLEMDSYPEVLERIIVHLVNNAWLHGLTKRIDGKIDIRANNVSEGRVLVTVRDNGIGIHEEFRDKVFDPFFTSKFGQGGSGIGLHMCWKLTYDFLGGSITASNHPDGGAIFTLNLPQIAPTES